ncbi:S9 family peptidase [SAR86 cluster bacterium]|jgi:oligopeptidase B|nr:S9 family peptidase [SAR86 cluster bacterium]
MIQPPKPKKIPKKLVAHGDERIDDYYWLRDDDRKDKEVISYLEEENAYLESWFASKKDLRKDIYEEMVSHIPDAETSMKIKRDVYYYFSEMESTKQYSTYFREKDNKKELLLDINEMAEGHDYYSVSSLAPSPDHRLIAYSEDLSGRREFNIKIKDLSKNIIIDQAIKNSSGSVIWSPCNEIIYYTKKDPITLITNKVLKHVIGESEIKDIVIYEEKDPEFNLSIGKSRSKKYLYIYIGKTESSETLLLDLEEKNSELISILPREEKHLYSVEDTPECFYVLTDSDNAKNFKLMKFNLDQVGSKDSWETVVEHDPKILIEGFVTFPEYIFLEVREDGLPKIIRLNRTDLSRKNIDFNDPAYSAYLSVNNDYFSDEIYFGYSSPKSPSSVFKENIESGQREIVWQQQVKNFDESSYSVERLKINARDDVKVPVSMVYKKDIDLKSAPILVYGYGSYGSIMDAGFRTSILPLLDKGFIFAVANIRGGSEMGREWYEDGKMLKKMNTFNDFIDSTKALINQGYGSPKKVFAMGGSAGGLLMGVIVNMEPELYKGIISAVPFVDVLTTMSDESIPLTTFEYKEWGNPAIKEEYEYIKQYSPYDNIVPSNYPTVLITSSLYDSQVQYYEPAKYVPKLRENSLSDNPILMKMNLIGGHAGKSGRLSAIEESALDNAFLLNLLD